MKLTITMKNGQKYVGELYYKYYSSIEIIVDKETAARCLTAENVSLTKNDDGFKVGISLSDVESAEIE